MKRHRAEWKKIFHVSDKALVSEYIKNSKLNNKKTNNPINKYAKDRNRHSSREDLQMANDHRNRCLTSLTKREMQVKTIVRYNFIPTRMVRLNQAGVNSCYWGWGEIRTLVHCWWECENGAATLETWVPQMIKHGVTIWTSSFTPRYTYPWEMKTFPYKNLYRRVHSSI